VPFLFNKRWHRRPPFLSNESGTLRLLYKFEVCISFNNFTKCLIFWKSGEIIIEVHIQSVGIDGCLANFHGIFKSRACDL
jgi:hypothetical protein